MTITPQQAAALKAPFPAELIQQRTKGGATLDFVSHSDVTDRLNSIDPNWTIRLKLNPVTGEPMIHRCTQSGTPVAAWFEITVGDVTRDCVGSSTPSMKADKLNALKDGSDKWSELEDDSAYKKILSDAIVNGAMRFGVAIQLWSKVQPTSLEDNEAKALAGRLLKIQAAMKNADEVTKGLVREVMNGRKPSELTVADLDKIDAVFERPVEDATTY